MPLVSPSRHFGGPPEPGSRGAQPTGTNTASAASSSALPPSTAEIAASAVEMPVVGAAGSASFGTDAAGCTVNSVATARLSSNVALAGVPRWSSGPSSRTGRPPGPVQALLRRARRASLPARAPPRARRWEARAARRSPGNSRKLSPMRRGGGSPARARLRRGWMRASRSEASTPGRSSLLRAATGDCSPGRRYAPTASSRCCAGWDGGPLSQSACPPGGHENSRDLRQPTHRRGAGHRALAPRARTARPRCGPRPALGSPEPSDGSVPGPRW